MIDRGEVDRILNSIKGNKPTARASITSERLAALCRRWLAVEDAPCVTVREALFSDGSRCGKLVSTTHERQIGQRVRLVPEAWQEVQS